ncbi:MAG: VWA domain-containing protein [Arenicella sp.]|nr:VWA domain-containing protein [Arenicella sp.]
MNTLVKKVKSAAITLGCLLISITQVNASGLLTPKGSNTQLQIQDHTVTVTIEDGYAITTVENTFFNPSTSELEAVYEFPVPENGSVAEFTVWIDNKPIIGEVVEKQRAKQLYETEKAAGRDAGLTEKKSFYRFESSVSPVRPQQTTKTRLVYMQAADVEGGIGRYIYPLEEGGTDQAKLDFWQTDSKVSSSFNFDLKLRSGFPVDAVRAPAHSHATISKSDAQNWHLAITNNGAAVSTPIVGEPISADIDNQEEQRIAEFAIAETPGNSEAANALNQDVVVYWRLQQDLPGAIELVAHREPGKRRGTFMLTVTPGVDLQPITKGSDWVFVLDRSGSMSGKYQTLMDATSQALSKLADEDRFRVLLFDDRVEELGTGWMNTSDISVAKITKALDNSSPGGGTDLYKGLYTAIKKLDSDRTSSIVLITDGVANVGKTEKQDFLNLMSKQDVRLFTAIMGNGADRPMLEAMTKASKGFATSVSNSDDIMGIMLSAIEKVKYQAMHDVSLDIKGIKTSDLVSSKTATLYRGQQMVIFGHYYGDGQALAVLNAKISGQSKQYKTKFSFPKQATSNPEIERLWAYATIAQLKDKSNYLGTKLDDDSSAIINTAIEYGLVTDYTSMIVMTDEQFEANGIKRNNRKRRESEQAAQNNRVASPVTQRQVDQNAPAFTAKRPSYSGGGGGGAINPLTLLLMMPIALAWLRRRIIGNRLQ